MWTKNAGHLTAYLITGLFVLVFVAFTFSGLFFLLYLAGQAAAAQPAGDEACLSCHSQPNLKTTRGEREISLYVDPQVMENSVHAQIACTSCHTGTQAFPHQKPVYGAELAREVTANCSQCHAQAGQDYQASIHGKLAAAGTAGTAYCSDCHGTHDIQPQDNPQALHNRANVVANCSRCHQGGVMEAYQWSFHGSANKLGYERAANCADCHTAHQILPASDPASSTHPDNLPARCVACHGGEPVANWAAGIEHTTIRDREKGFPLWITWKIFLLLIMVDIIKDLPIIILDLIKQIRGRRKGHGIQAGRTR
ncbi:MAG: hypothetical protein D9V47_04260 [Clostridia bacterium]|nr:MAG: hypothetical protein D9V47_04260 [Clostridia bacterium]